MNILTKVTDWGPTNEIMKNILMRNSGAHIIYKSIIPV